MIIGEKMSEIYLTISNVLLTLVILFLNKYYGFYITTFICCLGFLIILGIGFIAFWAERKDKQSEK